MVAIVVILASTITVFLIGAGNQVDDSAPIVGQSSGEFEAQDGSDGGIARVTHIAGEAVDASNLEVAIDATDACGKTARLIDLPSSSTGFASNEGYGNENFANDPTILAKSSPDVPPKWTPGAFHENNDNTLKAGSWFEFRIKGGACSLTSGDKITVRVVHTPTNSIIIKQELAA